MEWFTTTTATSPISRDSQGRTLVVGWFSLEDGGAATAGDLEARDVVCHWLKRARRPYDVALGRPFPGGVDWRAVDPAAYACVIHVSGPMAPGSDVAAILARFPRAFRIGVDVSMIRPLAEWNAFDDLIERDSDELARADLAFAAEAERLSVVGVIRLGQEPDYERDGRAAADAAVDQLLARSHAARVPIDTRLDTNSGGLRNAAEIEAVIGRMDLVVTTRLHGLVLGLKQGVPVLAIDPVPRGGKLLRQAALLQWPAVVTADALDDRRLAWLWDFCHRPEVRALARECSQRAATAAVAVRPELLTALARGLAGGPPPAHARA